MRDVYELLNHQVESFKFKSQIARLKRTMERISSLEAEIASWSDRDIRTASFNLRRQYRQHQDLNRILIPAFAIAREAAFRILGKRPFDAQVMGGIALHDGRIVEMKAGEGKTLTEVMPVYLNALTGQGVHIVTTNDYLARRDAEWMGPIYQFLGVSVGMILQPMKADKRRVNYAADIIYVTNQEVGFDYLRDNLVKSAQDRVLRGLNFAIVDEADSILIDEARTPLIIADLVAEPEEQFRFFADVIRDLQDGKDYAVNYETKTVELTEQGEQRIEDFLGVPLFEDQYSEHVFFVDTALKAKALFEKDRDYMVKNNEVIIVDEFTGRPMEGRRFMEGIHQAIEAKEGLKIREKDRVIASITFQNFFRLYKKISGMTGTGYSAERELRKVYELETVVIPTNRPIQRVDMDDVFYKTEHDKLLGLANDVKKRHRKGQPALIGTRSIEMSETVSKYLAQFQIPHQILNAKSLAKEAQEIAKAGREGIVTVATNMAGRGTDILISENVKLRGGLHVIGTERHQSRRIDDQLIGRAGRQGEPGSSQFHISAEDELMVLFAPETILKALAHITLAGGRGLSAPILTQALYSAQKIVESRDFDSRFYLLQYDRIMDKQRRYIYQLRDKILVDPDEDLKKFGLELLDKLWQDHLATAEALEDESNLLSYGQKNPFVEYALECHEIFEKLVKFFKKEMRQRGLPPHQKSPRIF